MNVTIGWKRTAPLMGREVLNVFSNEDNANLIQTGSLVKNESDFEKVKQMIIGYVMKSDYDPLLCFMDGESLNYVNEILSIEKTMREYNTLNLLHNLYIETEGNDPQEFAKLVKHTIDYIGIRINIPSQRNDEQEGKISSAINCLSQCISIAQESDKFLIIVIDDDSDLKLLKSYFLQISNVYKADDTKSYAIGAALDAFNIIIRPLCNDKDKIKEAYSILTDSEMGFSQVVMVDTSFLE